MIKAKQSLRDLVDCLSDCGVYDYVNEERLKDIEKALTVLEIIKEYPFILFADFRLTYEEVRSELIKEKISKEDYELVKEFLDAERRD